MRATYLGCVLLAIACGDQATQPNDGGVDAMPDAGGILQTDCVVPTGAGTMHPADLRQPETWTAAASPHVLPYDTTVRAQITIEPCAVVLIGARKTVAVRDGGRIVATGTVRKPIVIGPKDPQNWASITTTGGATLSFTYTGIFNGGDPLNSIPDYAAALILDADQYMAPAEILHADHLLVQDSASQGIFLRYRAAFSRTSTALIIKGSRGYPIHAWAVVAGTIPDGTYTGNGKDEILIDSDSAYSFIDRDVTFHDRGVPYHIGVSNGGGELRINGRPSPLATLTIEPNVTLRFKRGGLLLVDPAQGTGAAAGALVAAGTSAKPITFTSAEAPPAAGDWQGIYFNQTPDARDKLDYARVEYAGGASTSRGGSCSYAPSIPLPNVAAVRIFGTPQPSLMTNTTITNSAYHGIDRGWSGPATPSFITSGNNSVTSVRHCRETYPAPTSSPCPSPVPCP